MGQEVTGQEVVWQLYQGFHTQSLLDQVVVGAVELVIILHWLAHRLLQPLHLLAEVAALGTVAPVDQAVPVEAAQMGLVADREMSQACLRLKGTMEAQPLISLLVQEGVVALVPLAVVLQVRTAVEPEV